MFVSVVITTYNQPVWLEHVLWSYSVQSHTDFELIVADDGSTAETAQVIQRLRATSAMAIRHVWHEDCGFRKCRILNRAIDAASRNYVIFSDGDCIVRRDFIAEHVRLAQPGRFLSGGVVRLPWGLSHAIQRDDILSGNVQSTRWLLANGMPLDKKLRMSAVGKQTGRWLDCLLTTRATFNGHNVSAWRDDLIRVNGFDERMRYGGLDRELGERLTNAGVIGKQVRHRVSCFHLDHDRAYLDDQAWARNEEIRRDTRRHRFTWTPYGIRQEASVHQCGDKARGVCVA
jgi:glycosyltransferase involved in cell wall biosynthesis